MRTRAAGRARHEADRLESGFQSGSREDRRAEQSLDQHACGVVREDGDRVRPQRRLLAVTRDEAIVEALDERVARIELIDADPTLELVEAHQIEHERRAHDARRIPGELVERVAQQSFGGEHSVTHVDERVGIDAAQVVEILREILRALAHRLDRGDAHAPAPAFLAEEAEVLLAVR